MSEVLNNAAYQVHPDDLAADITHPADTRIVPVSLAEGHTGGMIRRGQVIDYGSSGYSIHAEDGTANCIAAEDTSYDAADETADCAVYVSGDFMARALVTDVDLTAADVESLRSAGIFLK